MEHVMEAFYLSGNIRYNISLQQTHNNTSASATNNLPANTTSKLIINARSKAMNKWSTSITDNYVITSSSNASGLCMPVCELYKLLEDSINKRNSCLTVAFPSAHQQDKHEPLNICVTMEIKYIGKKEFSVTLAPEDVSDVGRMEMLVEDLENKNHVLQNQVNGLQNQVVSLQQQFILLQLEMKMLKVRCFDERPTPFHNPAPLKPLNLNQQIFSNWAEPATTSSQSTTPRGWGVSSKHASALPNFSAPTPAPSRAPTPTPAAPQKPYPQPVNHHQPVLQPPQAHQPANHHPQAVNNQVHQPASNHPQPVQQFQPANSQTNNQVTPTPWNSWAMDSVVLVDPTATPTNSQPSTPKKQQPQQTPTTSPPASPSVLWEVTTTNNTSVAFWDTPAPTPVPMNSLWDSTDIFSNNTSDVLSSPVTASSAVPLWDFRRSPSSETGFLQWHD